MRRTSFLFMLQLSSFQTGSFSRVEALGSLLMDQIILTFEMNNVNLFCPFRDSNVRFDPLASQPDAV